ncbi:MAG: tetratricopeptide repeat protein, partial [Terriglobales bacterium]
MTIDSISKLQLSLVGAGMILLACTTPAPAQTRQTPIERASTQMQSKKFTEAIASLTEAIADDDRDAMAFFKRGQCFFCLGNYQSALEDYDHAIKLERGVSMFYLWRGTAHARLADDVAAVRDYEKAMRLDPALVSAFNDAQEKKSKSGTETAGSSTAPNANAEPPAKQPVAAVSETKQDPAKPAAAANT